ncbi:endonuclease V [Candidatus Pacearchaeota archaeon]|nr:endonuclease V [Candidatus Pacearchaeota archaeon]
MSEEEVIKKFGVDIKKISQEQIKLGRSLKIEDSMDFNLATLFAGIETIFTNNKIIAGIVVCDSNFEIIEEQFFVNKLDFPYLSEFRSYRELPAILGAFDKLQNKPEVVFIRGHGITHPRLGIASHFSLVAGVSSIGVAESLFDCDTLDKENILKDKKKVGLILQSKEKSNPLYISPGDKISIKTAFEISKKFISAPHKMPEPLYLAHKYVKTVRDELQVNKK